MTTSATAERSRGAMRALNEEGFALPNHIRACYDDTLNTLLFEVHAMIRFVTFALALALPSWAMANEPSLKKYTPPTESKKDEPVAKQFSMDKAVDFLDNAALHWTDKRGCFSCHTNFAYLYARPMISAQGQAHDDVRKSLEDLVTKRWPDKKPRWDAEVVAAAAALAYNDALTTKKLHPVTRTALDRIWTVQQNDGGLRWLKLNLPPMEYDDHYGVTLAALAVGVAPEDYAKTDQAKKGLDNLRRWLKANPAKNLHHKTMLLWASTYLDGFQTADEQKATVKELRAKQLPSGGWSASSLGDWKRADDTKQTPDIADGYGTGFTIFVLRRAGVPADDPALVKGIAWLKANQRESGRWFTRSLVNDNNKHYLSHVGSAFAVMAIQACEGEMVVFHHNIGLGMASNQDAKAILKAVKDSRIGFRYTGSGGQGYRLYINARDIEKWKAAIDGLIKDGKLQYYSPGKLDEYGYGIFTTR
jgi:squalene-hopene/tetraprenyl-beta-curcumene cyclase